MLISFVPLFNIRVKRHASFFEKSLDQKTLIKGSFCVNFVCAAIQYKGEASRFLF